VAFDQYAEDMMKPVKQDQSAALMDAYKYALVIGGYLLYANRVFVSYLR
jgi:hypothetical protein